MTTDIGQTLHRSAESVARPLRTIYILELCGGVWSAELPKGEDAEEDFRLLCLELMRLMLQRQLFTFVTAVPVTTGKSCFAELTDQLRLCRTTSAPSLLDRVLPRPSG